MQVPVVEYRSSGSPGRERRDPYRIRVVGVALLLGGVVWVLAIAELIDLCRVH